MRFRLSDHIRHEAWHFASITAIVGISICFQIYSMSLLHQRQAVHLKIDQLEAISLTSSNILVSVDRTRIANGTEPAAESEAVQASVQKLALINEELQSRSSDRIELSKRTWHSVREFIQAVAANRSEFDQKFDELHASVTRHQAALESQFADLERKFAQTSWTYFTLLTGLLLLESMLIFRPLITRFKTSLAQLVDESAHRQQAAAELELAKNELEHRNEELLQKAQELTDMIEEQRVGLDLLRVASTRFQELFHGTPFPCFSIDADFNVFEWNLECETAFGQQAFMVFGNSIFDFLIPESDAEAFRASLSTVFAGEVVRKSEVQFLNSGAELRRMLVSMFPVRGANGLVTGALISSVDVTEEHLLRQQIEDQLAQIGQINVQLELQTMELADANTRLEALATTDGLTGLKNHRAFREFLHTALEEYEVTGEAVSLCLLDVDFFKKFNDSFGHQAGDDVLRGVANCLRDGGGDTGCVARYGGEEFVVVLPGHSAEQAMRVAEFLRAIIEGQDWPNRQVTASFGVATLRVGTMSQNEMIECADQALYYSKERGRNCVTHFQDIGSNEHDKAA